MGCRCACSLRIQSRASNEVFTLSPADLLLQDLRSQGLAWSATAARAPEIRPASCPAIPQGSVIHRARAPAREFPAEGCPAALQAAARSDCPAWPAVFPEARSALQRDLAAIADLARRSRDGCIVGHLSLHCCRLRSDNDAGAAMFLFSWAWNRRLVFQQQRIAAGPAGLGVSARKHVGDAVILPFGARQMLDHHRTRPQRLRRFLEETGQHAVFKTLDIDLQRIDAVDAGLSEDALQAQRRHLDR